MSSEIKVDTISENTSANGVTIDSLGIKDGKITNLMNATLSAADLGTGLHIKSADSGLSSVAGGGDELIIEGSGDSGMHILSGASNDGNIFFGDSGDADNAYITYDHSTNHLHIGHGGLSKSNAMLLFHGSDLSLASNGETDGDAGRGGLCLNQGGGDGNILTFKSSDISHGFTSQVEADTYGRIKKHSANGGGLQILGLADDDPGLILFGVADATSGAVASNTNALIQIDARKTSSGSVTGIGSDMLCAFQNDGVAKVIISGTGKIHSDSSATIGTYDEYDDAHLVRAYDLYNGKGVIDSKFDKFISYNAEKLADLELIGRDDDGTPNSFVDITGFQRLHNGAIWQQYEKHQRLAQAVYELAKAAVGEDKANEILEQNDIKLLN